ncbi:MAG: hypothetical protein A3F74_07065 [Betaproteobacteria bacterium RIFCSPLOWO2_12_FULL_62_58]|nr:MAG: hypothetical protein A3F74_07065 [Betaproteobacteria bacterium RIFCSPLOWO2_12_FULL_62_58]
MEALDERSSRILGDLFQGTHSFREGVDALRYRANHEDDLDLLDELEQCGYLRRENEKYWLSLTALSEIDSSGARDILQKAETIFSSLKTYYRENPRDHLMLSDLAIRTGLDVEDIKECLSYMVEGSWWGGRSGDFFTADNPHIKPAEAILKYRQFADVAPRARIE